ncbi:phosphopantetheine-binding protein [Streptomyces sp. NPDC006733]|uniref:acyl carrier protein n=1 Tax=Streptomyces sp. NPDC006733 TaxID=3155460 RepID=UPI0033CDFD53
MISRETVVAALVSRLAETLPEARGAALQETDDLRQFAGFDSLGILETLVWLESEFDITIPDEDLDVENFQSVGRMADFVLTHR